MICVDWRQYSTDITYAVAKARSKHIGKDIATVLNKITYNMTKGANDIHLIGHSMGAHIVGFTGKDLPNQISRITGNSNTVIFNFVDLDAIKMHSFFKECKMYLRIFILVLKRLFYL